MKSFFCIFKDSARELKSVRCLTVTGIFIALSVVLEFFTIQIPTSKISFAFIAVAVIGMLYGPVVGIISAGICDVLGFIVRPDGAFLPAFTLVAMLQGLIYGIMLYKNASKNGFLVFDNKESSNKKTISFVVRIVLSRVLDILIVNIILNTILCAFYGWFPASSISSVMVARVAKNAIELAVDLPLMFIVLPSALLIYRRTFGRLKPTKI